MFGETVSKSTIKLIVSAVKSASSSSQSISHDFSVKSALFKDITLLFLSDFWTI